MSDITALAKGQECQIRLYPYCKGNFETTVPAHYSLAGVSGRGIKSPSTCVAWSCMTCHDIVDKRVYVTGYTEQAIQLAHAEGVIRTLAALDSMGYEMKLVDPKLPKIFRRAG